MSDRFDDEIRDSLRAEADGVTADDALRQRVRAATVGGRSWRRRAPLLFAAAAAVAIAVGMAAVLVDEDDEQTVDVVDDPTTSTSLTPEQLTPPFPEACDEGNEVDVIVYMRADAPEEDVQMMGAELEQRRVDGEIETVRYVDRERSFALLRKAFADQPELLEAVTPDVVPTAYLVNVADGVDDVALRAELADRPGVQGLTGVRCDDTAPAARPESIVAVAEDGRLVLLQASDGAELRELADFGPGVATEDDPAPTSISGVVLRSGTSEVYFETCCEPAAGQIFRVDLSQPEAEPVSVAYGYGMDISADGRLLAYVSLPGVTVLDLETGAEVYTAENADQAHDWVQAALNEDGTVLAVERALERGDDGEVLRSDARTTSLVDGTYEEHEVTAGRFLPVWLDAGLASAPGPGERLRDANTDASGTWLLVVTEDGRIVGRHDDAGTTIVEGPFIAADW